MLEQGLNRLNTVFPSVFHFVTLGVVGACWSTALIARIWYLIPIFIIL